jgi:hypothetical protein
MISSVPTGGSSLGYFGMGGVKTTTFGLVLVLTNTNGALWICKHATSSGCGSKSKFITLPSSFCSTEPKGSCNPDGTALDKSLNLYYVDSANVQLVECTASSHYQSCSVLPASSSLTGAPEGLFLQGSTFYVSDSSCTGTVWKGTKSSLSILGTDGDGIESITVSKNNPLNTPHVYGAYSGFCTNTAAHIVDVTDDTSLPSPFTTATEIIGLDSRLQFTTFDPGAAYRTTDTS